MTEILFKSLIGKAVYSVRQKIKKYETYILSHGTRFYARTQLAHLRFEIFGSFLFYFGKQTICCLNVYFVTLGSVLPMDTSNSNRSDNMPRSSQIVICKVNYLAYCK